MVGKSSHANCSEWWLVQNAQPTPAQKKEVFYGLPQAVAVEKPRSHMGRITTSSMPLSRAGQQIVTFVLTA